MKTRYQRAEKLLPWNIGERFKKEDIIPQWREDQNLEFTQRSNGVREKVIINYSNLQDVKRSVCAVDSPITDASSDRHVVSPNNAYRIYLCDHNLWLGFRNKSESNKQLTHDGGSVTDYYYKSCFPNYFDERPLIPAIFWSPDSRFIAVQCVDQKDVTKVAITRSVPLVKSRRPEGYEYPCPLPGDQAVPLVRFKVIDVISGKCNQIDHEPFPISSTDPFSGSWFWWDKSIRLYFVELSRGQKALKLIRFNPMSQLSEILLEEYSSTFISPSPFCDSFASPPIIELMESRSEFIWYSQKSGWGHLYLHDLVTGEIKHPITQGEYAVTWLHHVDQRNEVLFFSACGREGGRNPYYPHLYRINFDGSGIQLLTPEDCFHDLPSPVMDMYDQFSPAINQLHAVSPDGRVFIDTMSRVDKLPASILRSTEDGRPISSLNHPDESIVEPLPCCDPLVFSALSEDKQYELWGVIYRPADFDDSKQYPVILVVYGGPQTSFSPKRYGDFACYMGGNYFSLAELGFVVVVMDPSGTPLRSKAFHDIAYGKLDNGGGMNDQVSALKQLAARYSWLDLKRVGITGGSGGGFAAARAIFMFPDFFKVAVSVSGNHDQRLFEYWWAETFHGTVEERDYQSLANTSIAKNLKGKLLLVHGDMDTTVHPAHSLQLADALINNNKDFDLLILPNRDHVFVDDTYFIRRVWDYFVQHLLGETPPENYCISPPSIMSPANENAAKDV